MFRLILILVFHLHPDVSRSLFRISSNSNFRFARNLGVTRTKHIYEMPTTRPSGSER